MRKRLTRPRNNRQLAGVCAGVANYFEVDPTLIRIAYACLTVFSAAFPGLLLYLICAIIIPSE